MSEIVPFREKRPKTGGRQKGTPNRVTLDIRQALRDLADGYALRVPEWLERVAESDPADATRLWLAVCRFITPTLAATTVAEITPKTQKLRLAAMTDEELMQAIVQSSEAAELVKDGVNTKDELLLLLASPNAQPATPIIDNDELLR